MLRKHIAVDLGTANTLVFVQSQGIVINEPSVVAVDTINERVIAVGKEAKDYIGKTPQRISTIRPLRDGVIADFDAAQALIATFLKKVIGSWPIKPDVVICVPTNITDVERRAVAEKGGKGSSSASSATANPCSTSAWQQSCRLKSSTWFSPSVMRSERSITCAPLSSSTADSTPLMMTPSRFS